MLCGQNAIGADQTVLLQHPGNPLRSSQCNGNMRAAGIGADLTPALEISGSRPRTAPKICSKQVEWRQTVTRYCCHAGACSGGGGFRGGGTQHRWRGWWGEHQQHMKVPLLPVVRPAPVAAAAGESPTAAAPPPAVYGYTPEQRVGTERQGSGKLRSRRQTERGGRQKQRDLQKWEESGLICPALQRKENTELAGGWGGFEHIFIWHVKKKWEENKDENGSKNTHIQFEDEKRFIVQI